MTDRVFVAAFAAWSVVTLLVLALIMPAYAAVPALLA